MATLNRTLESSDSGVANLLTDWIDDETDPHWVYIVTDVATGSVQTMALTAGPISEPTGSVTFTFPEGDYVFGADGSVSFPAEAREFVIQAADENIKYTGLEPKLAASSITSLTDPLRPAMRLKIEAVSFHLLQENGDRILQENGDFTLHEAA